MVKKFSISLHNLFVCGEEEKLFEPQGSGS